MKYVLIKYNECSVFSNFILHNDFGFKHFLKIVRTKLTPLSIVLKLYIK